MAHLAEETPKLSDDNYESYGGCNLLIKHYSND